MNTEHKNHPWLTYRASNMTVFAAQKGLTPLKSKMSNKTRGYFVRDSKDYKNLNRDWEVKYCPNYPHILLDSKVGRVIEREREYSSMDQSPPSLDVHMDANQMVYVGKLKEVEVSNADEALQLLKQGMIWEGILTHHSMGISGDNRRKVCDTLLNKESSRSHSVFTIRLVMAPSEEEELYPVQ